jgi:hypothetical protein
VKCTEKVSSEDEIGYNEGWRFAADDLIVKT